VFHKFEILVYVCSYYAGSPDGHPLTAVHPGGARTCPQQDIPALSAWCQFHRQPFGIFCKYTETYCVSSSSPIDVSIRVSTVLCCDILNIVMCVSVTMYGFWIDNRIYWTLS
jgi:hypothetical protein